MFFGRGTPNELVFPFRGSYVCANFGENRSRNATMRVPTDGHTDTPYTLTDANRFYNLSHAIAICYSCGQRYSQWTQLIRTQTIFGLVGQLSFSLTGSVGVRVRVKVRVRTSFSTSLCKCCINHPQWISELFIYDCDNLHFCLSTPTCEHRTKAH